MGTLNHPEVKTYTLATSPSWTMSSLQGVSTRNGGPDEWSGFGQGWLIASQRSETARRLSECQDRGRQRACVTLLPFGLCKAGIPRTSALLIDERTRVGEAQASGLPPTAGQWWREGGPGGQQSSPVILHIATPADGNGLPESNWESDQGKLRQVGFFFSSNKASWGRVWG